MDQSHVIYPCRVEPLDCPGLTRPLFGFAGNSEEGKRILSGQYIINFHPVGKITPNSTFYCPIGHCFCIYLQIHFSISIFQILLSMGLNILLIPSLVNESNKIFNTCLFSTCLSHDFNFLKTVLYHANSNFYSP